jgi:hypothetical protein
MKDIKKITWKHIESLNWGGRLNYETIAKELWDSYTPATIQRMRTFVAEKQEELSARYRTKVKEGLISAFSNDGLSDVTAHVVGLGSTEYKKNVANPALLNKRAIEAEEYGTRNGYKESFLYCFHKPAEPRTHRIENLLDFKIRELCDQESVPSVLLSIAIYCEDVAAKCELQTEKEAWLEDATAIGALQALIRRTH